MTLTDILKIVGDKADSIAALVSAALDAPASVALTEIDAAELGEKLSSCYRLTSDGNQFLVPETILTIVPDATPETLANLATDLWPKISAEIGLESPTQVSVEIEDPDDTTGNVSAEHIVGIALTVGESTVDAYFIPASAEADAGTDEARALKLEELEDASRSGAAGVGLDLLGDVEVDVTVELGRRHIPLNELLKLTRGSIIELEKLVGEPLEVYVNNRLIADGEAVVIDDHFGIRITNVIPSVHRAA